jgi:hypothetical protein
MKELLIPLFLCSFVPLFNSSAVADPIELLTEHPSLGRTLTYQFCLGNCTHGENKRPRAECIAECDAPLTAAQRREQHSIDAEAQKPFAALPRPRVMCIIPDPYSYNGYTAVTCGFGKQWNKTHVTILHY